MNAQKTIFQVTAKISFCHPYVLISFVSLYLMANGEIYVETPPFVCPSDMVKEMKGGVEVETQVCDNTDGDGFHYNF